MNARNFRTASTARVAALFAAVAMTTLMLGTQVGLVSHYTSETSVAVLAGQRGAPVAQNAGAVAPQRQGG
jgi:hypothetical protein